jgi:alkylation response protein AidB-like acyl-CoA dehydrogenase
MMAVINGQKMWLTNGGTANLVAVPCRTGEGHDAPHRNVTTFLIEKEPGFGPNPAVPGLTVPGKIDKMGYKGVDTTELVLSGVRVPAARVLGGRTGQGFYQMMNSVEVGRVNVAARGCGLHEQLIQFQPRYVRKPSPPAASAAGTPPGISATGGERGSSARTGSAGISTRVPIASPRSPR